MSKHLASDHHEALSRVLPVSALTFACLHGIDSLSYFLSLPGTSSSIEVTLSLVAGVFLVGTYFWLKARRTLVGRTNLTVAFVGGTYLITTTVHLFLSRQPYPLINLILLLIGAAFFVSSSRALVAFTAIVWAVCISYLAQIPWGIDSVNYTADVLSGSVLAFFIRWFRQKSLDYLENLTVEREKLVSDSQRLKALSEMAGRVAHELNTPLTAILLKAEWLMENWGQLKDGSQITAEIQFMANAVHRIAFLTNQLRVFGGGGGRIDRGKVVDIPSLVQDALTALRENIESHQITIDTSAVPKIVQAFGSPSEALVVLLNVLKNATEAVSMLKDRWVKITVIETPECWDVQITDSGEGIPSFVREKLYQPFVSSKDRVGESGFGLSLSISKSIMQSFQGDLFLDESSRRTCFVIRFMKAEAV